MKREDVIIRLGRAEDADVLAQVVAMGIGCDKTLREYCGEDYLSVLREVVLSEHSQYSYRNALVAELDGVVVGGVIGYDGGMLYPLREGTYSVIQRYHANVPSIVDETSAGEFYVDSLAVMPAYRGLGVGSALLEAICQKAFSEGHKCVGLLVDSENPKAEQLYTSLGFRRVNATMFFAHSMWHMQREDSK